MTDTNDSARIDAGKVGGECVVQGQGFRNGGFKTVIVNGIRYTPEEIVAGLELLADHDDRVNGAAS